MLDAYLEFVDHWTILLTADLTQDPSFGSVPLMHASLSSRSSPENRTCCWLRNFLTMDLEMPCSRAIPRLLLTALASATIFNLKLRSYEWRRVLGILTIEQEVEVELWLFTMRIYQWVLQLSFKSGDFIGQNRITEYLLSTFVNRTFPKQEGSNKYVCIVCFSLQVWTFSFCFYVYH